MKTQPRTKFFTLFRRTYGDFDIAHDEPVAVSVDRENLIVAAANANKARTADELDKEVGFWVSDRATVHLL
jgi:hypothetical protein